METTPWTSLCGVLVEGYRVASGPSSDYPYGALERQKPIFKERGLDLTDYFNGTLNVDIRPYEFKLIKPEFTFRNVEWTDLHPPEHFSFSHCRVLFRSGVYDGWVYYPHPETKAWNFQNPSLLEVMTVHVPNIRYGDGLEVQVNPERIEVTKATQ
jgi:hypothetical protein